MAPEPRKDMWDMCQVLRNNWTLLTERGNVSSLNQTNGTNTPQVFDSSESIVFRVVHTLICLCGLVGNGIVIWLLCFCLKRNPYGVYILNLAIADFTYLSIVIVNKASLFMFLATKLNLFTLTVKVSSYLIGLSLLMAISVERCVSVLWPIWYKYHRPAHLSTIVCALIWVFFLIYSLMINIFHYLGNEGGCIMLFIYGFISLPTFLVLLMSSLTLFIRVQCYSSQRKPSRIYWTILLNVLAFLLLGVPRGAFWIYYFSKYSNFSKTKIYYFMALLSTMNSTVNTIIYFFVGRSGQQQGRKPLQEVLQRALTDNEAEAKERRASYPHRAWHP